MKRPWPNLPTARFVPDRGRGQVAHAAVGGNDLGDGTVGLEVKFVGGNLAVCPVSRMRVVVPMVEW